MSESIRKDTDMPTGERKENDVTMDECTLRDYFAAKALQGFWSGPDESLPQEQTREQFRKEMCGLFYEWADAMLEARLK